MIFRLLVLAALIGLFLAFIVKKLALPFWAYFVASPTLALIFYVANSLLINRYIMKRTPEFASTEELPGGLQKWELTAGLGIVPKWVSWLGLAAIASLLALLIPFLAWLLRKF